MKFKFPFNNVMGYRKTLENLAQKDFQEALGFLNAEIRNLEEMRQQIVEARESAFKAQVAGGAQAGALTQVHEFMKGQDLRIVRQQAKIQEIEKRVEDLREILRTKAIDYKIIEGLRDRQFEQFRIDENKREQKDIDENNVMRFRHVTEEDQ